MAHSPPTRMLEDVCDPRRVVWLARDLEQLRPGCREALAAHVGRCLVHNEPVSFGYAREVAILHAWLLDTVDRGTPCVSADDVTAAACRSRVAHEPCAAHEHGLRQRLRVGDASADHVRQHVYALTVRALAACPHSVAAPAPVDARVAGRVRRMLTRFANECTFKVHGDACIHHEIVTCVLAPWASAVMARHESPYSLASFAYPDDVNAVVRPIIETPPRERITASMWAGPLTPAGAIVVLHVFAEIVGRSEFKVLGNHNILRHTQSPVPMPFVYRRYDGTVACGVRTGNTFVHVPADTSVAEFVVHVLRACRESGYGGADDACGAIFDNAIGTNPLWKHVRP